MHSPRSAAPQRTHAGICRCARGPSTTLGSPLPPHPPARLPPHTPAPPASVQCHPKQTLKLDLKLDLAGPELRFGRQSPAPTFSLSLALPLDLSPAGCGGRSQRARPAQALVSIPRCATRRPQPARRHLDGAEAIFDGRQALDSLGIAAGGGAARRARSDGSCSAGREDEELRKPG